MYVVKIHNLQISKPITIKQKQKQNTNTHLFKKVYDTPNRYELKELEEYIYIYMNELKEGEEKCLITGFVADGDKD